MVCPFSFLYRSSYRPAEATNNLKPALFPPPDTSSNVSKLPENKSCLETSNNWSKGDFVVILQ